MLTGRLPYEAETALATLLLVAGPAMAPSVSDLRPDVPESAQRDLHEVPPQTPGGPLPDGWLNGPCPEEIPRLAPVAFGTRDGRVPASRQLRNRPARSSRPARRWCWWGNIRAKGSN